MSTAVTQTRTRFTHAQAAHARRCRNTWTVVSGAPAIAFWRGHRRRYEARTHTDESRAASAAKLNESFRKVMELMHDPSLKVSLSFEQLSYSLRDGTPVLQDATGEVSADEVRSCP